MIKTFITDLVYKENNIHIFALSFCLGNYVAFSPFVGFHTLMVLVLSPLFGLNMPVAMAASYAINNPFTMIPIYLFDYYVGHYVLYKMLMYSNCMATPLWMQKIEYFIFTYLHIKSPCIWAFLVGGNLVGVLSSIVLYPVIVCIAQKATE